VFFLDSHTYRPHDLILNSVIDPKVRAVGGHSPPAKHYYKHQSPASALSGLNDLYASEVPLRQVLTGWPLSTRGAQSQKG